MSVDVRGGQVLKPALDGLYDSFNAPDSATDPIHIVRRFERDDDREIVGFCAAALAFGRVASVLQSIERLVSVMGDHPAAFVRRFEPARDGVPLKDFVHRWTRGADVVALLWLLRQMLDRSGSIEGSFKTPASIPAQAKQGIHRRTTSSGLCCSFDCSKPRA